MTIAKLARAPPPQLSRRPDKKLEEEEMENIADIISQARAPRGEMGDLSSKARRLGKALEIADKWVEVSATDTEMFSRATIARDQLAEELSRTVFAMDVVYNKRLIAEARELREVRNLPAADLDLDRESRDSTLSDVLLDAYTTLDVAPLEVFGVGDRAAEERTRYLMMGALMVAIDAAVGGSQQEPGEASA
jgi:hypothetical protein